MKKFFQIFLLLIVITVLVGLASTPDRAYVSVVKNPIASVTSIKNLSIATGTRPIGGTVAERSEVTQKKKEVVAAYGKLSIPAISVNAEVVPVGVTNKGIMANPGGFKNVGWYKYGAVPGKTGSAVLAGHVDNALALSGVFKRLHELKVGEEVYFEGKDGKKLRFKVKAIETYPYNDAPLERIFNDKSGAYLNLITCTGTWNKSIKEYEERLVVYTELVKN